MPEWKVVKSGERRKREKGVLCRAHLSCDLGISIGNTQATLYGLLYENGKYADRNFGSNESKK